MAVNTYALIRGFHSPFDIALKIRELNLAEVESIYFSGMLDNLFKIVVRPNWTEEQKALPVYLRDKREHITLTVHANGSCACDYEYVTKEPATLISTGVGGIRLEILTELAKAYGGWIQDETVEDDVYTDVHTNERFEYE